MNDNFLIPNQSSLFNIKSIYNTFVEKLSNGGFENIILNPELTQYTHDSSHNIKQAGWDFNDVSINPVNNVFYLNDTASIQQDITPKLRNDEIYTLVLDLKVTDKVLLTLQGTNVAPNTFSPSIMDINYNDPVNYIQGLTRILEPVLDEFNQPTRFQVSFNINVTNVPTSTYSSAFLKFIKENTATTDSGIEFFNVSIVKGVFGVNLTKRQGFFSEYTRYNIVDGYHEVSMDDGNTFYRILTTRPEDVNDFIDVLVTNGIIYTATDCDLMFLRKDIPDVAERLITFLEGIKSEQDVNLDQAAKLVLDGGQIIVNDAQQSGTPANFFSLTVKRGDERDVGIRYNETIDRWQFTHDGIDWKILGSGDGSDGSSGGSGSSELEYYAEILDRTPYKFGYYDLFNEVDQPDSVISERLNYSGEKTIYKVEDYPTGPWYITTRNIWNPDHVGNTFGFFIHALTNKPDNAGLSIWYSLVGSGGGDPFLPGNAAWIPVTMNEIITPTTNIDEMYLKFEFDDETVEFHSYGLFYGVWDYSYASYTRLREYYTASTTSQTITVPNAAKYSVGEKALELYLNRVRQILGVDYNEVDQETVQMLVPVNVGDVIEFYEKFGYADFSESNENAMNAHIADTDAHWDASEMSSFSTHIADTGIHFVSTPYDTHIADTSIHCDCSDINTRITTLENAPAFTETDSIALGQLGTHLGDGTDAHDASAISNIPYSSIGSTNVQSAINELKDEIDGVSGGAPSAHNHSISEVTTLQTALNGKASSAHNHSISEVTGLQTALNGKAPSSHAHSIAQVTGLQTALDNSGGLGSGQTWQQPARSGGILYQNTTGKPIYVIAQGTVGPNDQAWLHVSATSANIDSAPYDLIVPNNYYYKLVGAVGGGIVVTKWHELR